MNSNGYNTKKYSTDHIYTHCGICPIHNYMHPSNSYIEVLQGKLNVFTRWSSVKKKVTIN